MLLRIIKIVSRATINLGTNCSAWSGIVSRTALHFDRFTSFWNQLGCNVSRYMANIFCELRFYFINLQKKRRIVCASIVAPTVCLLFCCQLTVSKCVSFFFCLTISNFPFYFHFRLYPVHLHLNTSRTQKDVTFFMVL